MSEKRITLRLNMDRYTHKKAYEIYESIPKSQRSDYIRMAIILMNDRNEQINYIKNMLSNSDTLGDVMLGNNTIEVSDVMLDFIAEL